MDFNVKTSLKCTKNQRFLKITKVFSGTVAYWTDPLSLMCENGYEERGSAILLIIPYN